MYTRSKTPIFNKPHSKHMHKNVSLLPPTLLLSLQPYSPNCTYGNASSANAPPMTGRFVNVIPG